MHEKHQKAQEWIDSLKKEPTMKQIEVFAGSDLELKTICVCLIDTEQKEVYLEKKNKNELTQRSPKDAFEYWINHPEWFFVFVPKDVITLQFMYGSQVDDNFLLAEELTEEDNYLEELISSGVFEPVMLFRQIIDCQSKSVDDFLIKIQEKVEDLENLTLLETSLNKFKYFQLNTLIEPDQDFVRREKKAFTSIFDNFLGTLKVLEIEDQVNSTEEMFREFMPKVMNAKGTFSMNSKHNYIGFIYEKSFSNIMEERLKTEASIAEIKKKERFKAKANLAFTVSKVGVSVAECIFPPLRAISVAKQVIDLAGDLKDAYEANSDIVHLTRKNFEVQKTGAPMINEILDDFRQSGSDHFKTFFIQDLKTQMHRAIKEQYNNLEVYMEDEIFESIYEQFFKEHVVNFLGKDFYTMKEIYDNDNLDTDHLLLEAVINRHSICKVQGVDSWGI